MVSLEIILNAGKNKREEASRNDIAGGHSELVELANVEAQSRRRSIIRILQHFHSSQPFIRAPPCLCCSPLLLQWLNPSVFPSLKVSSISNKNHCVACLLTFVYSSRQCCYFIII